MWGNLVIATACTQKRKTKRLYKVQICIFLYILKVITFIFIQCVSEIQTLYKDIN